MRTFTTIKSPEEKIFEAMNLALTSAMKLSKRSGVGWALLDENLKLLHNDQTIANVNTHKIEKSIARYGNNLSHLIITTDPITGMFDQFNLTSALDYSNCESIQLAHQTDSISRIQTHWDEWLNNWPGKLVVFPKTTISENLSSGPNKVNSRNLPWTSCVSAVDFYGNAIALSSLKKEFGFISYLKSLTNQSRAVLYTADQKDIIKSVDTVNHGGESQEFFEVESIPDCLATLRHCANEKRCNVTILCTAPFLARLKSNELIDEIIYHIALNDSPKRVRTTENDLLKTNGWSLSSCSAVGNCSRLILHKAELPAINIPLSGYLHTQHKH